MARLLSLIPRLTAPLVVRGDGLPSFGNTVQWPAEGSEASANKGDPSRDHGPDQTPYSSMATKISMPAPIQPEKDVRLQPSIDEQPAPSILQSLCERAAKHRVVFFGEQHQQPKVLSAQLQVLYHIMSEAQKNGQKVHVVFEQWSLEDQPDLADPQRALDNLPASGPNVGQGEVTERPQRTSEGFNRDHYMTLVRLVSEMGGEVWGGFPPREWARILARAGKKEASEDGKVAHPDLVALQTVQDLDKARFERTLAAVGGSTDRVIPPLPFARYDLVANVGWGHRTYLKGMFRPDGRPPVPDEVYSAKQPPEEKAGFVPAQALKDTFFAHSIASLLRRDETCIVVAICGAGHCEWGFGAPERVSAMHAASDEARTGEDLEKKPLQPFIFLSKPDDAGFWPGEEQTQAAGQHEPQARLVAASDDEQWQRKQADAILLYEWVD